jgi:hypothetical protein
MLLIIATFFQDYQVELIGALLLFIVQALRFVANIRKKNHNGSPPVNGNEYIYQIKILRILINALFPIGLVIVSALEYMFEVPIVVIYIPAGMSAVLVNTVICSPSIIAKNKRIYDRIFGYKYYGILILWIVSTVFTLVAAIAFFIYQKILLV